MAGTRQEIGDAGMNRFPSAPYDLNLDGAPGAASPPGPAANAVLLAEQAEAEAIAAEAAAAAARARLQELRRSRNAVDTLESCNAEDDAERDRHGTDSAVAAESRSTVVKRRWRRPRRPTVMAGVAVIATCALLAVSGYLVWRHQQADREQQARAEFAAAAGQAVVTLMSIDGSNAQQNVQRIIDNSTGQFRDDFQSTAKEFVEVAEASKSVTKASVRATAVESTTKDSAVVLVTAATTITTSAGVDQQPRTWSLSVDVVRDGDQIKMSKVDFVS